MGISILIPHVDCNKKGIRCYGQIYSGYTLRSEIEAPLITREVLPETYFLLVMITKVWQLMLRQDYFCSFKHHAYVEPCKILIPLAASSSFEIYYCNP